MQNISLNDAKYWILLEYYSSEFWFFHSIAALKYVYDELTDEKAKDIAYAAIKELLENGYMLMYDGIDIDAKIISKDKWNIYLENPNEWYYSQPRKNTATLGLSDKGYEAIEKEIIKKPVNLPESYLEKLN